MWHSSNTQVWQNHWDGGEGYKDMFLRCDYPVYLWDGPRVGHANWSCKPINYVPAYRDQGNFIAWNFGPSCKNWWSDVQFLTNNNYTWQLATSARYDEFVSSTVGSAYFVSVTYLDSVTDSVIDLVYYLFFLMYI